MIAKSLLQKARAVETTEKHTDPPEAQEVELMLALLSGSIRPKQAAIALGKPPVNHSVAVTYWAWNVLRGAVLAGDVSVKVVK